LQEAQLLCCSGYCSIRTTIASAIFGGIVAVVSSLSGFFVAVGMSANYLFGSSEALSIFVKIFSTINNVANGDIALSGTIGMSAKFDVDFKYFVENTNADETEIEKNGETFRIEELPKDEIEYNEVEQYEGDTEREIEEEFYMYFQSDYITSKMNGYTGLMIVRDEYEGEKVTFLWTSSDKKELYYGTETIDKNGRKYLLLKQNIYLKTN
jgi:hypothetical protein